MARAWLILFLLAGILCPVEAAAFRPPPTRGLASWYGEDHRGKLMANGEPFDPDRLTCASWHYPFGTRLLIEQGGRRVIVTVTDRGPNRRLRGRIVDLSRAAFSQLANLEQGLVPVVVRRLV